MKRLILPIFAAMLLLSGCWQTAAVSEPAIVPEPMFMVRKEGSYALSRQVSLAVSGLGQNSPTVKYIMKSLRHARMRPSLVALSEGSDILLLLNDTLNSELGDEGYLLEVRSDGVTLSANTEVGLFYAYQTFIQMLPPDASSTTYRSVMLPECTILDRPRFDWRGLHINVSGTPMPVKSLKRVADLMAAYKMNRLCVDGGWWNADSLRWEVDSLASHSADDAAQFTNYAALLGIQVLWDSLPPLSYDYNESLLRAREGTATVLEPIDQWDLSLYQADPRYQPQAYDGLATLAQVYRFDPLTSSHPNRPTHLRGLQCRLLTDCTHDIRLAEYMLLPRLLAVSENLWATADKLNWPAFRKKVEVHKERLQVKGYNYCEGSFTPQFSATRVDDRTMRVAIQTEVPNTYIFYSLDSFPPTRQSAIYIAPLTLQRGTRIKILPVYKDIERDSIYEYVVK